MEKKSKPVAICSKCARPTTNYDAIGVSCSRRLSNREKCRGVYISALRDEDWKECPSCAATDTACSLCSGVGWLFVGKNHLR
jgi:hypothetical protein